MELTQENVEKLNVAKMPDALLCKGLLLDAIEAGDKLEAENERLKGENEKLEKKLKKAENAFCVAHHCINRATIGCRKNCRKMEEFLFMIEEED